MTTRADQSGAPLRIVFAGTPEFAGTHLRALLDSRHQLVGVYTRPDRRAGRGKRLLASPVKVVALEHRLPVFQPASLRDAEAQSQLAALAPDIVVVVAYGLILPQAVLDLPRLGCINVHASLLPRWRGAAPIERAIEAGDTQSGITIMQMDSGLDTGDMLLRASCAIDEATTGDSLRASLAEIGPDALCETLNALSCGRQQSTAQDEAACSYAVKLARSEAELDWREDAARLARRIRAFCSANVTWTTLAGVRVRLWMARSEESTAPAPAGTIISCDRQALRVACGSGVLSVTRLQLPGKKVLSIGEVINARREMFACGQRFDLSPLD